MRISGMRLRKNILLLGLEMGKFFRPNRVQIRLNPFLESLEGAFRWMEEWEEDPIMRRRWRLLSNIVLWLLSRDGAYRIRAEKFFRRMEYELWRRKSGLRN